MRPGGSRWRRETSPEHQIILLAVSAALFAWLMRAALDFYFYSEKTFPEVLLLDIPTRELYSRVAIATAFLLTGVIISAAVRRLKRSEDRAQRLDKCVRSVRAINQLITRVNDRVTLCQRSCDELVTGLGYRRVQVKLDDVTHGLAELPRCDGGSEAAAPRAPVAIPIECDGEEFGELFVTLAPDQEWDGEERALLLEVAEDIAFSVRSMRTAERLRQQREEVQIILDSASAYITYKDRNGRYIRVNRALADMAGIPQDDWVGKKLGELVAGAEEFGAYADDVVMSTGEARRAALEALEIPLGTRWVQSDRIPYRDSTGSVVGVIALSVDVTDRMEAERALACKEEQLRQSQKMEAVGQLAGGIAHDFNNLLTAISGYTELACGQLEPGAPAAETLSSVSKAAGRAAALTKQLLAFSRKQPLWLAEQDLNDVVGGMTDMLERLIGEDIELVTELDEDIGRIDADSSQIEQVLMNLAVNARDAMPHGGRLTIGTSVVAPVEESQSEDLMESGRDYVCLRVTDTGIGMNVRTLSQIFEPFFTTKKPGVGTGLGLSVVVGIIEQHGGWVHVDSEPGRGTVFRICLPTAVHEPADDDSPRECEEPVREAPAARGERVLLVEDEDSVRAFAMRALTEWGYDIVEAASAEEALASLEADPTGFDLIFSDIVLPGRSGTQLAEEISALNPDARILLTSGYLFAEGDRADDDGFDLLFSDIVLPGKSGTQLAQEVSQRNPDSRVLLASGYLFPEDDRTDQSTSDIKFPLLKKPYSAGTLRSAIHEALS